MRPVVLLAVLSTAFALGGCGRGSALTHSATDVERAFFDADIPFQQEIGPRFENPLLQPPGALSSFYLPPGGPQHLRAFLIAVDSASRRSRIAYVFDSPASAAAVFRARPHPGWAGQPGGDGIRVRRGNVIVVAATAGDPKLAGQVRRALSLLR